VLDGIWHFQKDPNDIGLTQHWFLEENFQYLENLHLGIVPGCWKSYHADLKDFNGIAWYFTTFKVPNDLVKKKIFLHFEGVHADSKGGTDLFLDGKKLLTHKGAYSPFKYELTGLEPEKSHFLALRVDSSDSKHANQSAGINRSVFLEFSDWVYIDDHHFLQSIEWTSQNTPKSVELTIKSFLRNDTPQEWKGRIEFAIMHQKAVISTQSREFNIQNKNSRLLTTVLVLESPHLWSPQTPYLYEVETRVIDSTSHLVDEHFTRIGIRELSSEGNNFILNRQEFPRKGVRLEYTSQTFGSAIPTIYLIYKLTQLKNEEYSVLSFDYLPDSIILDLADTLGFCVIQSADEFKVIDAHAESLIKTMIFRDRNHPSVISWKYTRELDPSRSINSEIITKWIHEFERRPL